MEAGVCNMAWSWQLWFHLGAQRMGHQSMGSRAAVRGTLKAQSAVDTTSETCGGSLFTLVPTLQRELINTRHCCRRVHATLCDAWTCEHNAPRARCTPAAHLAAQKVLQAVPRWIMGQRHRL